MGLFDFFKKKETVGDTEKHEKETLPPTKTLEKFFKIDIHNIFGAFPIRDTTNPYRPYLYFIPFSEEEVELGNLTNLEVEYFPENKTATLIFEDIRATDAIVSNEMREFMDFCFDSYGIDKIGLGPYTGPQRAYPWLTWKWENIEINCLDCHMKLIIKKVLQNTTPIDLAY